VVLLADLLMRLLDRVERRRGGLAVLVEDVRPGRPSAGCWERAAFNA
jgi:hypothetical protein